jgi:hypothetical protein
VRDSDESSHGISGRGIYDEMGTLSGVNIIQASDLLLLGVSGKETSRVLEALEELIAVHKADAYMYDRLIYGHSVPSWFLTDLQHAKLFSATLENGSTMIDASRRS